ncbi:MAG TPA: methyl-accepting chemotaxis protein [Pyrinomonadaceae bacterium]
MAKTSANSLLNSLKGKIWLASVGLAFFICIFGLISYLIISFLTNDTLYAVFIPFVFVAFSVVIFGWWLAGEVVGPVEKVSLLAKSLERGVSAGLPKTSGSTETDELLETLQRISQQVQKLVTSMDEAANGKLDAAFSSNPSSDRISQTFQKLLAKVAESIHAKQDLEKLELAVSRLSAEVAGVKSGNLDAEINSDFKETKELSATIKFLIENLSEIAALVKNNSSGAHHAVVELRKMIQELIQQDENRVQEMNQASVSLKKVPQIVQKISEELSGSAQTANHSIEKARQGTQAAQQNLNAVSVLRKQIQEAATRVQRLNERSQEINKIAKTIEDLAHRTSLVALNASIQATELGEKGHGFAVVAEEVERLAERAGNTNKHISTLNQAIQTEIGEVARSLETTVGETANLSKYAIETGNALGEMERYIATVLNLQNKVMSYTREQTNETEKAFEVFIDGISETENAAANLKESAGKLTKLADAMEELQQAVAPLKLPSGDGDEETEAAPNSFANSNFPAAFEEEVSA